MCQIIQYLDPSRKPEPSQILPYINRYTVIFIVKPAFMSKVLPLHRIHYEWNTTALILFLILNYIFILAFTFANLLHLISH